MDLQDLNAEQQAFLATIVTDPTSPVYFMTGTLEPAAIGAAMARFSRNPGGLRDILLAEFFGDVLGRTERLIGNVIGEFGDDSVQQLAPVQFVVEGASNLMTKQLEWSRLMSYLEQSTRYIPFDQRDAAGRWKFYTPSSFPAGSRILSVYENSMGSIFQRYSDMITVIQDHVAKASAHERGEMSDVAWNNVCRAQALDAVRGLLPVATRSSLGIVGNAQSLENLIYHLRAGTLTEGHEIAAALLEQARRLDFLAPFVQRADRADRGDLTVTYRQDTNAAMRELTGKLFAGRKIWNPTPTDGEPLVTLVDHHPHDEAGLLRHLLFSDADGWSLRDIDFDMAVQDMTRAQVQDIIRAYIGDRGNRRHKPGRGIEHGHFVWEIVGDYGSFRDMQRHRMVDGWEWQRLSPHYGYHVPQLVIDAGAEKNFRSCFEQSAYLYGILWDAGYEEEAQYATLLGHFMRYSFGTNLRELFHMLELRTQPSGHAAYRRICRMMYEKVQRVYPTFAAGMKFIDTDGSLEDLARLESERDADRKGLR